MMFARYVVEIISGMIGSNGADERLVLTHLDSTAENPPR
jgi:hypothetical protein